MQLTNSVIIQTGSTEKSYTTADTDKLASHIIPSGGAGRYCIVGYTCVKPHANGDFASLSIDVGSSHAECPTTLCLVKLL